MVGTPNPHSMTAQADEQPADRHAAAASIGSNREAPRHTESESNSDSDTAAEEKRTELDTIQLTEAQQKGDSVPTSTAATGAETLPSPTVRLHMPAMAEKTEHKQSMGKDSALAATAAPSSAAPTSGGGESSSEPASKRALEESGYLKLMGELKGSLPSGLTAAEAAERLEKFGPNEIEEIKRHPLLEFLKSFWGPLPWAIEVAAILSAATQAWTDFGIIMFLLIANAIIGFIQERNAGNAIAELRKSMPRHCRVSRDGEWQSIDVSQLVPGDLIAIKLGDMVPADGCVVAIESDTPLQVDQSSLTGESTAVKKQLGQLVLSASLIKEGEAEAMVLHTGKNTFIGRAAELVRSSPPCGHFQRILTRLANFLIVAALVCVAIVLITAGVRGENILDTLRFAMALLIVSVPVALPVVLSATMAVGARYLSQRNAVCSRLTAVEELSAVDVLCCDKTGTLTKNQLSIEVPVPFQKHSQDDVIMYAALASNVNNPDAIDRSAKVKQRVQCEPMSTSSLAFASRLSLSVVCCVP